MTDNTADMDGPHQSQQLATAGDDLAEATAAMVMVHGRGATARSIIQMASEFHRSGMAYLAPQAKRNSWYPNSFLQPVDSNEPGRTSGLQAIDDAIQRALDAGIPRERIMLLGFSQGGCLASEYVARNPTRYGGLAALSGGLIGPEVSFEEYDGEHEGDLRGTPVFLGCSDTDPHIPEERVHETADILEALGADVEKRLYPGMGHGVNEDELEYVSEMVAALLD